MLQNLFSNFAGYYFLLRWLHVFFGIIWIGHLYYFNFVQGAFLNETDASAKSQVLQKLAPRALWWFRWGAMGTFVLGLVMLLMRSHAEASAGQLLLASPYWINILTGSFLGTLMFLNVWLVIWPKQKIVIQNATQTAQGKPAMPEAAAAGARALVASRTNTLFSIPMLFFMLSASHMQYEVTEASQVSLYWIVSLILIGALQGNALYGKTGPLTTIKGVISSGFALTFGLVALITILL